MANTITPQSINPKLKYRNPNPETPQLKTEIPAIPDQRSILKSARNSNSYGIQLSILNSTGHHTIRNESTPKSKCQASCHHATPYLAFGSPHAIIQLHTCHFALFPYSISWHLSLLGFCTLASVFLCCCHFAPLVCS